MSNSIIQSRPWDNSEELQKLFFLRSEGIQYKLIAMQLNRTVESCRKKFQNHPWEKETWYDSMRQRGKNSIKQSVLESYVQLQDKREELSKVKMDIIADRIETAVMALPNVPKAVYKKANVKTKNQRTDEDVMLVLGDQHIGHEFTLEETGGLSEYNLDIFEKRMKNLEYSIKDIYELHSELRALPNLHIVSLGDVVAGMNDAGNWSPTYIAHSIYDQAIKGFESFTDLINYCLGMFDTIHFYGLMGNHGRGAAKGTEKEYVNWDLVCYKFLEARFANNPRVKFHVPMTWWIMETIRNHKFLFMHGDDVRAGSALLKGVVNATQEMASMLKISPDYTIVGHFHAAGEWTTNSGKIIINGSFLGPDIYALKNLQKSARAEQKIFGIHDKRGITWRYDIDLNRGK